MGLIAVIVDMPDLFVALGVMVHDVSRDRHALDDPRSSRRRRGGLLGCFGCA
jgi:hypothetical protein